MAERIEVRVRDCQCPDTPHPDGDVVYLLPHLSLEGGAAAELDLIASQSIEDRERATHWLLARWTSTYVRYGAVGWNWTQLDERGRPEPLPFDIELLLADYRISKEIANKANELYSEAVMGPLLEAAQPPPNRAQRRSRTGRTASSTSRRRGSTPSASRSSSPDASDGPPLRIAR
jgi:hypothetical protein